MAELQTYAHRSLISRKYLVAISIYCQEILDDDDSDHLRIYDENSLTPQYYIPFTDGQSNGKHTVGVQISTGAKEVPFQLEIFSNFPEKSILHGLYELMLADPADTKPHLNHGRLIWQKSTPHQDHYLYYDHSQNRWIINNKLQFKNPDPLASLLHSAPLPLSQKHADEKYSNHVPPSEFQWKVCPNKLQNGIRNGELYVKESTKTPHQNIMMQLNKVYLFNELEDIEDDESIFDGIWNDDTENEKHNHTGESYEDDENISFGSDDEWEILNSKDIFQTHWTFLSPEVYHTFHEKHDKFDHSEIYKNPVKHLTSNRHIGPVVDPEK
ncbi:hypothetical protein IE077_002908 [Cardiosporidium cionae]|uniref:Uncharacterized protein n=1 Tax=Cardiosporidium cionae TaxID=476202 RepID=A0ABQ7JAM3_9APIC|nr:hypothetical protein IE077_002908 [Cardiosporidium cionae]|eukprot:KAF8820705.1 hypothetical protein IE077_002908 [Cardiosporidium cionae]